MAMRKRTANSFYSYSAKRSLRQEEVAAYRRIVLATIVIVGLIVGGYFLGVPLIANLGNSDGEQVSSLGSTDNIAPAAPNLNSLPSQTNTSKLKISGSAESGSTVTVMLNEEEAFNTLADNQGIFEGEITLQSGQNDIYATALDSAGNKSRQSKSLSVVYDATPPSLVLVQNIPSETTESTLTISAKTEPGAKATINQRQAIVNSDGAFSITLQLKPGQNPISILATDGAGNTNKIERSINFKSSQQASASARPKD